MIVMLSFDSRIKNVNRALSTSLIVCIGETEEKGMLITYLQTFRVRDDSLFFKISHEPVAVVWTDHVCRREEHHKPTWKNARRQTRMQLSPASRFRRQYFEQTPSLLESSLLQRHLYYNSP